VTVKSDLGAGLRAAREARGWSLRAVASAAGISASLLSQVENGKTQPSVSTLYALVTHLGASIDDLLGTSVAGTGASPRVPEASSSPAIQRAADNPTMEMENGVTWERLAVGGYDIVDPLVTTYAPGGSSSPEGKLMRHPGIEYGYVVSGELTVKLDFDTFVLHAGDSLCFDSVRPHLYINHTQETTRGLWFVVDPHDMASSPAPPAEGNGSTKSAHVLAVMRHLADQRRS
jgi:transcriptional regulator with XRE-family HTH domain